MIYRVESRSDVDVLVDGVGCRPATPAEAMFWNEIERLTAALSAAQAAQQKAEQQLRDAHSAPTSIGAPDLTTEGGTK